MTPNTPTVPQAPTQSPTGAPKPSLDSIFSTPTATPSSSAPTGAVKASLDSIFATPASAGQSSPDVTSKLDSIFKPSASTTDTESNNEKFSDSLKNLPGISGYENASETGGMNFIKGYLNDIKDSVGNVWNDVTSNPQNGSQVSTPGQALTSGSKTALDVTNAVLSPITGVISPVLKPIIQGLSDETMKNPVVVQGLNAVNDLIDKHPQVAEDAGNLFQTFLNVAGIETGTEKGGEPVTSTPKVETVGPTTPVDASNLPERLGGPKQTPPPTTPNTPQVDPTIQKTVTGRVKTLTDIEKNSSPVNKVVANATSKGVDVKNIVANTDLLQGSVDSSGKIDTLSKGGAVDQFNQIINKFDSAISDGLDREGISIPFDKVKTALNDSTQSSRIAGGAKTRLINQINDEISGLQNDVDKNGNIPLSKLQDAKISSTQGVDYTKPETKINAKTIASVYRKLIEDNSKLPVKQVNAELSKYYTVQDYLEALNGKTVKGGKLGTYFAKTIGAVAGGHLPLGPIGPLIGSEIAGTIKGTALENTFGPLINKDFQPSDLIKNTVSESTQPRLGLPSPKPGSPNAQNNVAIPLTQASSIEPPAQQISRQVPIDNTPRLNAPGQNPIRLRSGLKNTQGGFIAFDFSRVAKSLDNIDRSTILDFLSGKNVEKAQNLAVQMGLPHAFGTNNALKNDFVNVLNADREIIKSKMNKNQ